MARETEADVVSLGGPGTANWTSRPQRRTRSNLEPGALVNLENVRRT